MKLKALAIITTICILFGACSTLKKTSSSNTYPSFFKIGHRGTRGLMPENTIPAMIKGIETGANTVEMDVHITKDGQVVVYHDESFDPTYTLMPNGSEIPKAERKKYTFYQMNYADIRPFIIGTKKYPAYPQQQNLATYAPLLSEMVDSVDHYTKSKGLPSVYYLVEIKSSAATDGFAQPAPKEMVDKVMASLKKHNLGKRLIIQSFDVRPLQVLHRDYPDVALGFLTGDAKVSFEENMKQLAFTPQFYNPHYGLANAELVKKVHAAGMMICPWTVNDVPEMKRVKALQVNGIITDYPNYFAEAGN